ncbi:WD repeat-containing protein 55-like protein [Gossypium australe]|uniref:WD repeat-containing protein 55-like protein n=1 Tax=Gossypium australe TaxID=47621 RepID=A0A5B6V681_9ROSI|nr:WD repeat-containing protein 55-like protein [Gossypium australe]
MEASLGEIPFGIDFHPSKELVAVSLITGDLHLYKYNTDDSSLQRCLDLHAHAESCRTVRFINGGQAVATGSKDCSILATDVETGSVIARLENAHENAINSLINLTESTVATGDDEGCIKVWDTRQRSCSGSINAHDDYISDMNFVSDSMKLLTTSGDGTLSVCNLRTYKVQTRSEFSEDELSSVVVMKNGRKVICGSQGGTLLLYSWGFFKDCSDRFVDLSPNSVEAMLKLDEDRLITGSENGLISLVGILPNRIIQPIAEHSEYPVEGLGIIFLPPFVINILLNYVLLEKARGPCLKAGGKRRFLGSISHDQMLKLWDLNEILQGSENAAKGQDASSDSDSDGMDVDDNPSHSKKGLLARLCALILLCKLDHVTEQYY